MVNNWRPNALIEFKCEVFSKTLKRREFRNRLFIAGKANIENPFHSAEGYRGPHEAPHSRFMGWLCAGRRPKRTEKFFSPRPQYNPCGPSAGGPARARQEITLQVGAPSGGWPARRPQSTNQ